MLDDDPDAYPVIPEHLRSLAGIRGAARPARPPRWAPGRVPRGPRPLLRVLAVCWAAVGAVPARRPPGVVVVGGRNRPAAIRRRRERGPPASGCGCTRRPSEARLTRGIMLAVEAAVLLIVIVLLIAVAPWWAQALAVAAVGVPLLARAGKPEDPPIIRPATTAPRFRVINADMVLQRLLRRRARQPGQARPAGRSSSPRMRPRRRRVRGSRSILPSGTGFDAVVKALPDARLRRSTCPPRRST